MSVPLEVIFGPCGRGTGRYAAGAFMLPNGTIRFAENVEAIDGHGVISGGQDGWSERIVGGLKTTLGLGDKVDVSGVTGLALAALTALADETAAPRALHELRFRAGADEPPVTILVTAHPGLAALISHDAAVIREAVARVVAGPGVAQLQPPASPVEVAATVFGHLQEGAHTTFGQLADLTKRWR